MEISASQISRQVKIVLESSFISHVQFVKINEFEKHEVGSAGLLLDEARQGETGLFRLKYLNICGRYI